MNSLFFFLIFSVYIVSVHTTDKTTINLCHVSALLAMQL